MQFKYMVINGQLYGSEEHLDLNKIDKAITNVDFKDDKFSQHYADSNHNNNKNIIDYLFALSLCHTIIIAESTEKEMSYNASSPDELALVNVARYLDCTFYKRNDDNDMVIKFKNEDHEFKLLNVFEFNSYRKRMSVIVQDKQGQIKLICKGADSVILKLLDNEKRYFFNIIKS